MKKNSRAKSPSHQQRFSQRTKRAAPRTEVRGSHAKTVGGVEKNYSYCVDFAEQRSA
jgi:hypothetical protein